MWVELKTAMKIKLEIFNSFLVLLIQVLLGNVCKLQIKITSTSPQVTMWEALDPT